VRGFGPCRTRAIEAKQFDALPAAVYLRGFLTQLAKALKLDALQVSKTSLKRLCAARPDFDE
jgi:cytoskeletal protein RodZ